MKNLILRTVTGLVYVAILVFSIVYSPFTFGALFAIVSGLVTVEFCNLVNAKGAATNPFLCMLASMLLFFGVFSYFCGYAPALLPIPSAVFLPYLITMVYLTISQLYSGRTTALLSWAYTMMSQMYIALPVSLLCCISFVVCPYGDLGVGYIFMYPLAVFLFLWSSDTGAYVVGSLLGKHIPYRLFPSISPNKSWVGTVGGTLLAVAVGAVISLYEPSLKPWQWMLFGLIVAVFGTWGDLVESQIKRQLGVKDSGAVLPGHGGFLDRFDSSLLAIPASVVYIYSIWTM